VLNHRARIIAGPGAITSCSNVSCGDEISKTPNSAKSSRHEILEHLVLCNCLEQVKLELQKLDNIRQTWRLSISLWAIGQQRPFIPNFDDLTYDTKFAVDLVEVRLTEDLDYYVLSCVSSDGQDQRPCEPIARFCKHEDNKVAMTRTTSQLNPHSSTIHIPWIERHFSRTISMHLPNRPQSACPSIKAFHTFPCAPSSSPSPTDSHHAPSPT